MLTDYYKKLARTACAFANTSGGFIVFGVRDMGQGKAQLEGVEKSDDLAKYFGDKIKSVNPTLYFDFLNPPIAIPASDRVLFVVEVAQSSNRPHMTAEGTFYYRTNEGNRIMSYDQIKEAFLRYEERKHKLNLLYIELISNLDIAKGMIVSEKDADSKYSLLYFDTAVISDLLPEVYSIIQTDRELVQLLMRLRIEMGIVNSKVRLLHNQTIMPLSNISGIIKEHNKFLRENISNIILPLLDKAIAILESRFALFNPLVSSQKV